ncbi:L,D-transpeptidase/peptidoglycan binding protein [Actinomycetaceae bacterium TAE3-ERU4]|nr:L,D-transpeptidase/peptidoglycan binding protein [Actinomycetaceae bacterium TAE3-ERU4]
MSAELNLSPDSLSQVEEELENKANSSSKKKMWAWIVAALVLLALLASAVTYFMYYRHRALPGTSVAGVSVSGQKAPEISTLVEQKFKGLKSTINLGGKSVTASYSELGLSLAADKTAQEAVNKPSWTSYFTFWKSHPLDAQVKLDSGELTNFINREIGDKALQGTAAKLTLKKDGVGFDIEPSKPGTRPDVQALGKQLESAAKELKAGKFTVKLTDKEPDFNTAAAQQIADQTTKLISTELVIAEGEKSFSPSGKERNSFVKLENGEDGKTSAKINESAIAEWVDKVVGEITVQPRKRIQKVNQDGKPLGEPTAGREGVSVENSDDLKAAAVKAITAAQPAKLSAKTRKIEPELETITVLPDNPQPTGKIAYEAADDEKWVDVNLTRHTITAYIGKNIVRGPEYMVSGKPSTPTVRGIFPVRAKVRSQTMRGPDYVTPGVPWVVYFHGDYALHGAPWRSSFGYSGRRGSHGCVNLPVGIAKWYYQWTEIGTKVVTHG